MDLSGIPSLSIFERQILASSENKEMFAEKFEEIVANSPTYASHEHAFGNFHPHEGSNRATYFDLAPGRKRLVNGKIAISKDSHEYETSVAYNGVKIPIKVPVAPLPETVGDVCLVAYMEILTIF